MSLVDLFSFMLEGDIWTQPLIELTKSAKISCKASSYGALPDLFFDLRSCTMEQMQGIVVLKKSMADSNYFVCALGRYLKKTSHLID